MSSIVHPSSPTDVSSDPLLAWRKEFPILEHTTYMISHSLGPMPRRAQTALQEFADVWATRGIRAWEEGWWNMPMTCGDLIGSIIGRAEGSRCHAPECLHLPVHRRLMFRLEWQQEQAGHRWS